MALPEILKKPPVIIGGIILVVVIIVLSKRGTGTTSVTASSNNDAVRAANVQIASLNAQTEQERIRAGVGAIQATLGGQIGLAQVEAQRIVALSKIASDENVGLALNEYQYDIANKQLENNRILGLTQEDTRRLVATQQYGLGMSTLDTNRYIATRALESAEVQQARQLQYDVTALETSERVNDINTSRALTYQTITGQNQTAAIRAAKPSAWSGFLSSLGQGLGRGIPALLGA